ncbi:MAG TPA: hypothetical protein VFS94_10330 [Gemmatimonadales bacterium]|nr:hypothetical protein [Gemmatimonadales bacterium]
MRVVAVVALCLVASCSELPTSSAPPPGGPPEFEFALVARIGDIHARATASAGFGDTVVTVGKGGFILDVSFENAGLVTHSALTESEYELRLTGTAAGGPLPIGVVYTPFAGFDGSIYWVAPGQRVEVWIGLWHKSGEHYDAGPYRLFIMRRPHGYTDPADPVL